MRTYNGWIWASICGVILGWAGTAPCHAQTLTGSGLRLTSSQPRNDYIDNSGPYFTSTGLPYVWSVYGDEFSYDIKDEITTNVPFRIDVGAAHGSLVMNSMGVGIGTFFPQAELHVSSSDTPKLRLEQNSSAGFPQQSWELRSDSFIFTLLDVNHGTFPFVVNTSAPDNSLRLDANGSVGMGTSQPTFIGATNAGGRVINVKAASGPARFVVQGSVGGELNLVHNNGPANQRNLRIRSEAGVTNFHVVNDALTGYTVGSAIAIKMSNGNIGLRVANPTNPLQLASGAFCSAGGAWMNASSRELKQDIEPLTGEQAREALQKLQPVGYRYKNELAEQYVGFIAEDVPDLVATNDRKSLSSMDITAVLTKVVQDQDRTIEDQRQTIAQQQALLAAMNARLTKLEERLGAEVPSGDAATK